MEVKPNSYRNFMQTNFYRKNLFMRRRTPKQRVKNSLEDGHLIENYHHLKNKSLAVYLVSSASTHLLSLNTWSTLVFPIIYVMNSAWQTTLVYTCDWHSVNTQTFRYIRACLEHLSAFKDPRSFPCILFLAPIVSPITSLVNLITILRIEWFFYWQYLCC